MQLDFFNDSRQVVLRNAAIDALQSTRTKAFTDHADHVQEHAAPLWLQAQDWQAAQNAVEAIASWRKIPEPLQWMLQARLHLNGLTRCWGLVAELAWLAPHRLREVVEQSAEPQLQNLMQLFSDALEGTGNDCDFAWFPAWLLIERPALAPELTLAHAGQHTEPEQAMRLMLQILGYERQGEQSKVVACRKALRDLHPELFALYMKAR